MRYPARSGSASISEAMTAGLGDAVLALGGGADSHLTTREKAAFATWHDSPAHQKSMKTFPARPSTRVGAVWRARHVMSSVAQRRSRLWGMPCGGGLSSWRKSPKSALWSWRRALVFGKNVINSPVLRERGGTPSSPYRTRLSKWSTKISERPDCQKIDRGYGLEPRYSAHPSSRLKGVLPWLDSRYPVPDGQVLPADLRCRQS